MTNSATKPSDTRQSGERSTVYLGLGSNLDDRLGLLRRAVQALNQQVGIDVDFNDGIASLYETSPVGGPPEQPHYLNSACRVMTSLSPAEVLSAVLTVEASLGRTRSERWGSRPIDIDLLLVGDLVCDDPGLTLPHPRMHERRFVLEPLAEIAGAVVHPCARMTITELAERLRTKDSRETVVRLAGPEWVHG